MQLGSLDVWMGRQIGKETVHWVRMGRQIARATVHCLRKDKINLILRFFFFLVLRQVDRSTGSLVVGILRYIGI